MQKVKQLSDTGLRVMNVSLKWIVFYERARWALDVFHDAPRGKYRWVGKSRLRSAMISMVYFFFHEPVMYK